MRACLSVACTTALLALVHTDPSFGQAAADFPTLPPDAEVGHGVLAPCHPEVDGRVECGRFRVWENRDARAGRTLDVAFVVMRALGPAGHRDAVTQFNGGPGVPMTPAAARLGGALPGLRSERDVLLVDHRGTGRSDGLVCDVPYPGGIESRFERVFPVDHATACRDALSARANLSQYTTERAADDLAELTRWLGYSALNLIGGSYGTREVQVFLRRHPGLVRTAVFNGVGTVQEPLYVQHARLLEETLQTVFRECAASAPCAEAYPELAGYTAELLDQVRRAPPWVDADGRRVPFGPGALGYALRGLLYTQAARVPSMIYQAHAGDWQPLADYYLERQAWVGDGSYDSGYHFSVLCAEDMALVTRDEIRDLSRGTFMGDALIGAYKDVCDVWPAARLPRTAFAPVTGSVPALILSGGRDPVTPATQGDLLHAQLTGSVHVVIPNGGHGQGGPCVQSMIRSLIESGTIEGIDVSCVRELPPTRFVVSPRTPGR